MDKISEMSIKDCQDLIAKAQVRIMEIRDACAHPETCVAKTHGANQGNYDPSADCYWTDFNCSLCGKKWRKDGSL